MEHRKKHIGLSRLTSFLLVLAMLVTMFPGMPHAHAAEAPSLVITNAEGEEADTFVIGEPIFVTANSSADDWVGFYSEGSADGSSYWFWYYVDGTASYYNRSWEWENGETYNIYDTVPWADAEEGGVLPAGKYVIRLENNPSVTKTITLVAPESTESALAIQEGDVIVGEPFEVTATSYSNYAWVGLYSGTHNGPVSPSMSYFYTNGHNGMPMEFTVFAEGDYTLILYKDYDGTSVDKIVHFTAKAAEVELPPILTTDKTEYKFGEPIMVTVNTDSYNSTGKDWVGIFNKGAVPSGSVNSYFWYYPSERGATYNVLNGTTNSLGNCVAGEYSVILLANDGYTVITSVDITITKEETSRVVTDPTCTEAGTITITYSDGTTETVPGAAPMGHAYGGWVYNEETKQHTHTCANDETHTETENCTFGEGVVTTEPTETTPGVKTFACTVCGGTYTEEIPATGAVETGRETVAPTCTEEGYTLVTYSDGSTEKVDIVPALGHDTEGVSWTHVEGTKTHEKLCKRSGCGETAETEDCSFTDAIADGVKTSTCTDCGYSFETVLILYTDKTEYALGEPIYVTVNNQAYSAMEKDWVGIWEAQYGPQDKISLYYYYPSGQGQTVNIYDGVYQRDRIIEGDYVIRLLANDQYDVIASVKITVGPAVIDESKTKVVAPTCEEDGYTVYTYTDGHTETVVDEGSALGHAYGDWNYNAEAKKHFKTCANDETHVVTENCTFGEGVATTEPTETTPGVKTFTCTVCEGTYTEEIPATGAVETGRETVAPTCTEDGYTLVTYSDGTSEKVDIVPALGHDTEGVNWISADAVNHVKLCKREGCGEAVETEKHSITGTTEAGVTTHSCSVCDYEYEEVILATDKTEYKFGEPIMVTTNYTGDGSWVGLYHKGDNWGDPATGHVTSYYWFYVRDYVEAVDITTMTGMYKGDRNFTAGECVLILFDHDGYEYVTEIEITVTKEETKRQVVEATCEEAGYTYIEYNDGTSEKTDIVPALGHAYGDWVYNKETKQHTKTCANDAAHVITESCTFDDGVVTKEPTAAEKGEKTFTCTVCHGTYIQELAATGAELVEEKVTKEPTCTEPGVKTSYYSDGSAIETPIPALGHSFEGAQWTYNDDEETHSRACVRNCGHTETEDCDMVLDEEKGTFTCSVCGGSYLAYIITTDKTEYKFGEPIYVTVNPDAYTASENDWVGLYKRGEKVDPDNGGIVSIYWYWISELGYTVDINWRTNPVVKNENGRDGEFEPGEYSVVLLTEKDGNWYYEITSHDITISEEEIDMEGNTYGLEVNGVAIADSENLTFRVGDEIILKPVVDGLVGSGWMGVYMASYDHDFEFSANTPSNWWDYFYNINGKEINLADKIGLEAGHYTVVLFGDGGYDKVQYMMNFEIVRTYVDYEVVKEPTCLLPGQAKVLYEGETEYVIEPIPALGHDWGYNQAAHSHTCKREDCGITESCDYVSVSDENGNVTHTCKECRGSYTELAEPGDDDKPAELLRIAGANRITTSLLTAAKMKELMGVEKFDAVVVASGLNFPDALSGSYLAAVKKAPILLTAPGFEAEVNAFIQENLAEGGTVYVLGGEAAVPNALLEGLEGVNRVAGDNRLGTNLEILKEAGVTGNDLLICTAMNFPDSLSAAAAGKPILLVGDKLTAEQEAYLKLLGEKNYYIIGGTSAVSKNVEFALQSYGGTVRLAGDGRYDTSVKIAEIFFDDSDAVILAYGRNYPDGLCGGAMAAALGAPVILVEDAFIDQAAAYVQAKGISGGYILGGTGLLSDASVRTIWALAEDAEIGAIN